MERRHKIDNPGDVDFGVVSGGGGGQEARVQVQTTNGHLMAASTIDIAAMPDCQYCDPLQLMLCSKYVDI